MQSTERVESAVNTGTIWRATDPNYPGVPQPPPELLAKSTSRANVEYEIYVLAYAAQQRGHVLMLSAGVVIVIGAAYYLSPPWLVIAAAIGIGMVLAGAAGFAIAAAAHARYSEIATSVSETYDRTPRREPTPDTVRPLVVAPGSRANQMSTGRLNFPPDTWQRLFDRALANGGMVNRDDVAKKALTRQWYYGEGYGRLLEELTRIGFIDPRNRLTPAALAWYAENIPLPLAALPARPRNGRTDGGRTGADDTAEPVGEWGE